MRFLAFGVFNTALTYALYCLLLLWLPPQPAYAVVYVLGIGLAYLGNAIFVFGARPQWRSALAYPLVYLLPYLANAGIIELLLRNGIGPRVALALALAVVTPLSFLLNRSALQRQPPPRGGGDPPDRRLIGSLAVALVATSAYYAPGLFGYFQGDDLANLHSIHGWIAQDRLVPQLASFFASGLTSAGSFYRPLVMVNLALNESVAGTHYAAWYAVDLLVHLANTAGVLVVAHRLAAPRASASYLPALLAALLFALCPLLAEGVTWVSARSDAWVTLFCLVGTWCWLSQRTALVLLALPLCLALALGHKESAAVLPLQLALLCLVPRLRTGPRVLALANCFAMVGAFLAWRAHLFGSAWLVYAAPGTTAGGAGSLIAGIDSFPTWWDALFAATPSTAAAYLVLLVLAALVAAASLERGQRLACLALAGACGGLVLATLLNLGALPASGEGGRLAYAPIAWLALAFGVALAGGQQSRLHRQFKRAAAALLLVAVLVGLMPLRAVLDGTWQAQEQVRAMVATLPDWAARHDSGIVYVPERIGPVVVARNAQGGLVLPPLQATPLMDRVIPTLPAELAGREHLLAGGLLTQARALRPTLVDDGVIAALLAPATATWPDAYACWSTTQRQFVDLPVPASIDPVVRAEALGRAMEAVPGC